MKKVAGYDESDSKDENVSSEGVEESSSDEDAEDDCAAQQEESESDTEQDKAQDDNDQQSRRIVGTSSSGEQCTFDLRNLVAVNSHQLDARSLYSLSKSKSNETDNDTIPLTDARLQVDEDQLLEKAQDGCAQIISALWQLPMETSDAGPLVTLPSYFEIKIPRALVRLHCRGL